jgi:PAS domain S-box-containing protein
MGLLPRQLNNRTILLIATVLCISGIVSGWVSATRQSGRLIASMRQHSSVMVRHVAENSARFLILRDYAELESFLLKSAELPDVVRMQVCEPNGWIVGDVSRGAHGRPVPATGGKRSDLPPGREPADTISGEQLVFWQPIEAGSLLGWLRVELTLAPIKRAQQEAWAQSVILAIFLVVGSAAMIFVLLRPTAVALGKLARFARKLNDCKGERVRVDHDVVEIVTLEESLNYASERLLSAEQQLLADRESLRRSKENYRRLLDTIQEGIWVIDGDAVTTFVNPRMGEILGYAPAEILGRKLFDFMDERGQAVAAANIERRKQGIKEQHDFEFIRKDGRRIHTRLETGPIFDGAGEYAGAIAAVADITERKAADEALRESERRLKTAQRMAHIGYWERDIENGTVTLSEEACRIFGFPRQEGGLDLKQWHKQWLELIHPDDRLPTKMAATVALQGGPRYDVEYRLVRPNGEIRFIHSSAEVTRDESGRPLRMLGMMQDITERKLAEEVLCRLNEELEQRVRERTAELVEKCSELERMNRLFVGRELRMMELKERIKALEGKSA